MIKARLPRKWRRQTPIFMTGAILFLIGVLGFACEAWLVRVNQLDHLVSSEVVVLAQMPTSSVDLGNYLPDWLQSDTESPSSWIGSEVALLSLDQHRYALGARYQSQAALKDWMQSLLPESDSFTTTKTNQGTLWTPEFSSDLSFLVMNRWVFAAESLVTLQTIFDASNTTKLHQVARYKEVFKGYGHWQFYIDSSRLLAEWEVSESLLAYGPLLQAAGETVPAVGLTGKAKSETEWAFVSEFLMPALTEKTAKNRNTTIPDLAYYAPNQVLLFLNGQNLYQRYKDTRDFLSTLNPQFELIFDGVWQAQITRWFGDEADFENDFLQAISGPYAIMLDYSNGLDWLFISESQFGTKVTDLIKTAQGRFSPRVEVIDLPDGTTREELVATAPGAVDIEAITSNGFEYSVAKSASLNKGELAFVQSGNNFLISSDRDFLESALAAKASEDTSLASNNDFRQAVLFKLGQAESFGFLNMDKFRKTIEPLTLAQEDGDKITWWQTLGSLPVRNIILSRRLETDRVLVKWLLFEN